MLTRRKELGHSLKNILENSLMAEELDKFMNGYNKTIYIIGAGGHGKVVADIAKKNGYKKILFLDDSTKGQLGTYSIVGTTDDIDEIHQRDKDADFFIAIGNNEIREKMFKKLKERDIKLPVLIHSSAVIDETVKIEEGTVIIANAVINAGTKVGKNCIINTSASVDHDCIIEDYVHISPGVHIAGTVHIGKRTWVGIGSSVVNNINIYDDVIIGAGTTIIKDIEKPGKYVGMPLRRLDQ